MNFNDSGRRNINRPGQFWIIGLRHTSIFMCERKMETPLLPNLKSVGLFGFRNMHRKPISYWKEWVKENKIGIGGFDGLWARNSHSSLTAWEGDRDPYIMSFGDMYSCLSFWRTRITVFCILLRRTLPCSWKSGFIYPCKKWMGING